MSRLLLLLALPGFIAAADRAQDFRGHFETARNFLMASPSIGPERFRESLQIVFAPEDGLARKLDLIAREAMRAQLLRRIEGAMVFDPAAEDGPEHLQALENHKRALEALNDLANNDAALYERLQGRLNGKISESFERLSAALAARKGRQVAELVDGAAGERAMDVRVVAPFTEPVLPLRAALPEADRPALPSIEKGTGMDGLRGTELAAMHELQGVLETVFSLPEPEREGLEPLREIRPFKGLPALDGRTGYAVELKDLVIARLIKEAESRGLHVIVRDRFFNVDSALGKAVLGKPTYTFTVDIAPERFLGMFETGSRLVVTMDVERNNQPPAQRYAAREAAHRRWSLLSFLAAAGTLLPSTISVLLTGAAPSVGWAPAHILAPVLFGLPVALLIFGAYHLVKALHFKDLKSEESRKAE